MARKFSEPSEGASVSRVETVKKQAGPAVEAAADLKDGRYKKAVGEVAGAAAGAYVGGEAGAKVGGEVGSRLGDKADRKDREKKAGKDAGKDKTTPGSDAEREKAEEEKKAEEKKKKKNSPIKNARRAMQAAQAVNTGMKLAAAARLMMLLKMLLQMALAVAQAAIGGIMGVLSAIGHAIVTGIAAVVSTIGAVATAVAGGVIAVVVAVAVAVGVAGNRDNIANRDDGTGGCNDDSSYMYSATAASGSTLENAKKIYAFFKAYGLADTNIAGILGNWAHESGIDPTSVETIYTERFLAPIEGTRKYELWQGPCEVCVGYDEYDDPVWAEEPVDFRLACDDGYGNKVGMVTYTGRVVRKSVYTNYHATYPAIKYFGIGLGQWTNGRNRRLLQYADMFDDYAWYDLELQLMFCVDDVNGDDSYHVSRIAGWTEETTATEAAVHFCENWEGITYQPARGQSAEEWLVAMSTWQAGVDYDLTAAESLVAAANALGSYAADSTGSRALRSCSGLRYSDNGDAAAAAVSFAWGPGEAYDNDGTDCWLHLFNSILPGDPHPRCCDRTVAVAMRWSGTDTEFEYAGTTAQLTYLLSSPRWEKIDWQGKKSNLRPGDVLIRNDAVIDVSAPNERKVHHILMYVGNDAVKAKFGEEYNGVSSAPFEFVSGSIDEYSPHVGKWSTGSGSGNYPSYYVFRNVEKYSDRPDWTGLTCVS